MHSNPFAVLSVLAAACAALALQPATQPKPAASPEARKPESKAPEAKAAPSAEYKLLSDMCGTFDLKMTITPRPGAKPLVVNATATREMALGGNFMVERVEAQGPMPFGSVSYMGFNADAKDGPRFEVVRMSSSTRCLMPERGMYDAAKKTFTLSGEHEIEGMTGKIRNEINVSDMDHQVVETWLAFDAYAEKMKGMKVPEYHGMTMEYTRKGK